MFNNCRILISNELAMTRDTMIYTIHYTCQKTACAIIFFKLNTTFYMQLTGRTMRSVNHAKVRYYFKARCPGIIPDLPAQTRCVSPMI